MWLQLDRKEWVVRGLSLVLLLLVLSTGSNAQGADSLLLPPSPRLVKIDFLSGYYRQDGDRSAVTGGEGTEALKDFASVIKINIPISPEKDVQFDTRISYFTSASSDNIDPRTISSASSNDTKISADVRINRHLPEHRSDYHYRLGLSHEAHFMSIVAGGGYSKTWQQSQSTLGATVDYTMDIWGQYYDISRLYPSDYTGPDNLSNNKRHSLQIGLGYRQIINERLQVSVSADLIQQFGLLSTPFHRIYFADEEDIDIERLPDYRFRMPLSARLNWFAADWLVTRSYYRFYWDNFGLKSHSVYLELPFKAHSLFSIYPFYRYHFQYGHKYFATKGAHLSTETFYTSDYDQSGLQAHYAGGGFRWVPFSGKRQKKQRRAAFQSVEARAAWYRRSDGFHSWIVSGGLSWSVLRKEKDDKHFPQR